MDEDAMLVAIGQMDIDEARGKYSDEWAEFCKKLSHWKSIHQLFRLKRLTSFIALKTSFVKDIEADIAVNNKLLAAYDSICKLMEVNDKARKQTLIRLSEDLKYLDSGQIPTEEYVKRLNKWMADSAKAETDRLKARKEMLDIKKESVLYEDLLGKLKQNIRKYQDEYDITKPYAMGLLVADIFYSLAAALQGDIY